MLETKTKDKKIVRLRKWLERERRKDREVELKR
jgi:hypothetical protein